MGIYIPGMEMPKNCFDCPLFDDVYTDADGDDDYSCGLGVPLDYYQASGETNKGCPLIPIPPHGRLGDLDELYAHLNEWYLTNNPVFTKEEALYIRAMLSGIAEAPTVIPASGRAQEVET